MDSAGDRLQKHTEAAERLLTARFYGPPSEEEAADMAQAQVHATLALAAAIELIPGGINCG